MNQVGRHADTPLPPFPPEYLSLPDEDLAAGFWWWWVAAQAEAWDISRTDINPEIEEAIRRKTVRVETDNVTFAGLEKILRLLARNDYARAGAMIRKHFCELAAQKAALNEATKSRNRQSNIARKPRPDALQLLLENLLLKKHPPGSFGEVLDRLRRLAGGDIIEAVNDVEKTIDWEDKDGSAKQTSFAVLSNRLTRARKKIGSR